MHPKPIRETFSPSEPKATCFISLILAGGASRTLGLVWNQRGVIASAIFTAVLVIAGVVLCSYAFLHSPPQHALMNTEGIVALSFLAILCTRSRRSDHASFGSFDALQPALVVAMIAVVISIAFVPIVRTPFLYDDYTHITDASRFTLRSIVQQFGPVIGRGLFFRPVGFFLYWLNYLWAGANPTLWHACNIALHAICSCLTYVLCREIGLSQPASLGGALLFGFNGVSAEAVAWIDAGFVSVTTLLVLLSLIFVCRYAASGRTVWLVGALASGACGMLSKETGYCLPFLIACLALFRHRKDRQPIWRAACFAGAFAVLLFAYRWWALGGIGGYAGAAGEAVILNFSVARTLDALLLREWAVLFFPFNWSAPASPMLRAALAAIPFALAACAWMVRPPRRPLIGCLSFVIATGLPVQHLLLLSPDLGGSRTLYLGSVGWALLWALVFDTMSRMPRIVAASLLLVLQASMLEHNLGVWRDTAELARSVCVAFGQMISGTSGPVVVSGLPAIRTGAVFLQNGFPQCVEMSTGVPADRIQVRDGRVTNFIWSEAHGRIEKSTEK
jgi:hypothetical protein